jgi:DNA-binding GntR family transcriptional regulator
VATPHAADPDPGDGQRAGRLQRLEPRTFGRDVAAQLRAAILDGTLRSGSPLVERRIAQDMGVSRAPVREALRKLEEEGLVVTFPYRGTYVTQVTPRMVDEILSLRTVLDGFALERALPQLATRGVARLQDLLGQMVEAAARDDQDELVELHMAFHRTFYELADHELLLQFWKMMESQLRLYDRVHQQAYQSLEQYVAAHREIVELVSEPDLYQLRLMLPRLRQQFIAHITENVTELLPRPTSS